MFSLFKKKHPFPKQSYSYIIGHWMGHPDHEARHILNQKRNEFLHICGLSKLLHAKDIRAILDIICDPQAYSGIRVRCPHTHRRYTSAYDFYNKNHILVDRLMLSPSFVHTPFTSLDHIKDGGLKDYSSVEAIEKQIFSEFQPHSKLPKELKVEHNADTPKEDDFVPPSIFDDTKENKPSRKNNDVFPGDEPDDSWDIPDSV